MLFVCVAPEAAYGALGAMRLPSLQIDLTITIKWRDEFVAVANRTVRKVMRTRQQNHDAF
jgi:hypothetical protein